MSTAMMGSQPAIFAAIRADRPTAPTPKTAKPSPGFGLITLNTAPAGLAAAGERAEQLDRRILAHLHRIAFLRQRKRAERRLLEECAVDRFAVLRQQRGAIGARAFHLQIERMHTVAVQVLRAVLARAAPRE